MIHEKLLFRSFLIFYTLFSNIDNYNMIFQIYQLSEPWKDQGSSYDLFLDWVT